MSAESPLRASVENGELVIRVGINRLDGDEYHLEIPVLKFDNRSEWVKDVISELFREEEDGRTPIGDLLDTAMKHAIENGSIGLSIDSPGRNGTCWMCDEDQVPLWHTKIGSICQDCKSRL